MENGNMDEEITDAADTAATAEEQGVEAGVRVAPEADGGGSPAGLKDAAGTAATTESPPPPPISTRVD